MPNIPGRLIFFDNLRVLGVVFVTLFHSTMGYTLLDPFWTRVIPIDVFMMVVLFFIAGYFALPSLQKKGVTAFLGCKLKRFGIPLLVSIVFVIPILNFFHYHTNVIRQGGISLTVFEYWVQCIYSIGGFHVGFLNISEPFNMPDQFYQHYLWFLSVLIVFFCVLCGLYLMKKNWFEDRQLNSAKERRFGKSFLMLLVVFGLLLSGYYYAMIQFVPTEGTFFSCGNFFQLQPSRLGMYFGCFLLGSYAYSKRWFQDGKTPTTVKTSGLITLILVVGVVSVGRVYFDSVAPSFGLQFAFAVFYNFLCLSVLMFLITVAIRIWNRPSLTHQKLSPHSYNMYLLHYIPIVVVQTLLSYWTGIPLVFKSLLVFLTTLGVSYGLSEYGTRFLIASDSVFTLNPMTLPKRSISI